ncbi:katanin p60 ATPase-containing subunit A-like 2 [Rhopilema esculentum]|uniref:katanin p60 ATPase-containing subunit A-like 2 n=1 Tax=Rhopilema esculentum TaxID=499914 RepID=UPI0031CF96BE
MTQELSYMQLKTANEARISEEQRTEQRKRNILLLILHYLTEDGYLDTAHALETEAGVSLKKFEICDNIDLQTILQEFETYYHVKFNKWPKITKRVRDSGDPSLKGGSSKRRISSKDFTKSNSISLPNIDPQNETQKSSATKRPSSDTKRKTLKAKPPINKNPDASEVAKSPSLDNLDMGLSVQSLGTHQKQPQEVTRVENVHGKKVVIDYRAMLNNALSGSHVTEFAPSEKLLKPLGGVPHLTGEWRDLAAVVSKDIYLENPNVTWNDIIGLDEAKRLVKEAVVYPIKYPQLFTGILSPWKGLLLYGPPGTGKTLLAKAVATECNTTFFNISASTIVSKWRGDSEKLVRVLFELARFHAPSTIFLDELDSLMSQRGAGSGGSGEHEGSRRMKTELLVQMDGLSKSEDLVFLLAASNLPWELDHAMLRRLEKRIIVDLPNDKARKAMFEHYLPPEISNVKNSVRMTSKIDYDLLAQATVGYSGSDICLVCKEAAMRPVRKIFAILEDHEKGTNIEEAISSLRIDPVTTEDVKIALERTKPSTAKLRAKYEAWQKQFESV